MAGSTELLSSLFEAIHGVSAYTLRSVFYDLAQQADETWQRRFVYLRFTRVSPPRMFAPARRRAIEMLQGKAQIEAPSLPPASMPAFTSDPTPPSVAQAPDMSWFEPPASLASSHALPPAPGPTHPLDDCPQPPALPSDLFEGQGEQASTDFGVVPEAGTGVSVVTALPGEAASRGGEGVVVPGGVPDDAPVDRSSPTPPAEAAPGAGALSRQQRTADEQGGALTGKRAAIASAAPAPLTIRLPSDFSALVSPLPFRFQRPAASGEAHGFIFHCNGRTHPECLARGLFGMPACPANESLVAGVTPVFTQLFLFNIDTKCIEGVWEGTAPAAHNLYPYAWTAKRWADVAEDVAAADSAAAAAGSKQSKFGLQMPVRRAFEGRAWECQVRHVLPRSKRGLVQGLNEEHTLFLIATLVRNAREPDVASAAKVAQSKVAAKPGGGGGGGASKTTPAAPSQNTTTNTQGRGRGRRGRRGPRPGTGRQVDGRRQAKAATSKA